MCNARNDGGEPQPATGTVPTCTGMPTVGEGFIVAAVIIAVLVAVALLVGGEHGGRHLSLGPGLTADPPADVGLVALP